jgi:hypothetical protein
VVFGLPEHESFLDHVSQIFTTPINYLFKMVVIKQLVPKIDVKPISAFTLAMTRVAPAQHHYYHHYHHYAYCWWVEKAIACGWKVPEATNHEWRRKARSNGWIHPYEFRVSSVGVECTPSKCDAKHLQAMQTGISSDEYTSVLRWFVRENLAGW